MAYEIPGFGFSLVAGADLSAAGNQYKFVKLNASGEAILCAAATDVPIGVLQNTPKSGSAAAIMATGITKLQGDADLTKGDQIGTSADGQADAKVPGTDITEYVCGRVLEDNTVAGGLITAMINCLAPHRAV